MMDWNSTGIRFACLCALVSLVACSGSSEDGATDDSPDSGPVFDAAGDALGGDATVTDTGTDIRDAAADIIDTTPDVPDTTPDAADIGPDADVGPTLEEGYAFIDGTRSLAVVGQAGVYTVTAPFDDSGSDIVWDWSVVGGTLVSGQGTDTIEVEFTRVGRAIISATGATGDVTYLAGGGARVYAADDTPVLGDLDNDGDLDGDDLAEFDAFVSRVAFPTFAQRTRADVDLDGRISDADRTLLQSAVDADGSAPVVLSTNELTAATRINLIHPALLDPAAEVEFAIADVSRWHPIRGGPGYATGLVPIDPMLALDTTTETDLVLLLDGEEADRWPVTLLPVPEYDGSPGELVADAYAASLNSFSALRAATAAYYEETSTREGDVAALLAVLEAAEAELAAQQEALLATLDEAPTEYVETWERLLAANGVPDLIANADAISDDIASAIESKSSSSQAIVDVICAIEELMDIADQISSITGDVSDALGHAEFLHFVPGLNVIYTAASKLVDGLNLISTFIASLESYVPGISPQLRIDAATPLACGASTSISVFVEVDLASICGARGAELGAHIENTLTAALTKYLLQDVPYFSDWYDHWRWDREEMWGVAATIYDGAASLIGGAIESLGIQEALGGLVAELCNSLAGGDVNPDLSYDPVMAGIDPTSVACSPDTNGRTVVSAVVPTCGGSSAIGTAAIDCDCPCEDSCTGPGDGYCEDDLAYCCQPNAEGCFEYVRAACPAGTVCDGGCDCACENTCDPTDPPRCSDGAVVTCSGSGELGDCFEETVSFCPEGETCVDGVCAGVCIPACDPDTFAPSCAPDGGVTTCELDADACPILVRTPCSVGDVCVDGTCEPICTDECDPADYPACGDLGPESCEASADGCFDIFSRVCPDGTACEGGTCVGVCTDECSLGAAVCTPDGEPALCEVGPDGCTTFVVGTCDAREVCEAGSCVPACTDECVPGSPRTCEDGRVASCEVGPEGCAVITTLGCPIGTVCDGGSCVTPCTNECVLGEFACFGNNLGDCEVGADGCTDLVFTACEDTEVCDEDAADCVLACRDECVMGETTCIGTDVGSCEMGVDGCTDLVATPCDAGLTCTGGACEPVCIDECTPGDPPLCDADGGVVSCTTSPEGCGVLSARPCPIGTTCEAGDCVDTCIPECAAPGDITCSTGFTQAECVEDSFGCPVIVETRCASGVCEDGVGCVSGCEDECALTEPSFCIDGAIVGGCEVGPEGCALRTATRCTRGTFCEGGVCVGDCTPECEPGEPASCIDPFTEEVCELDGTGCPRWVPNRCPSGVCEDGFGCEPTFCEPECVPGEVPNVCEGRAGPFIACQEVDGCPRRVMERCEDRTPICDTINGCVPECRGADECDPADEPFVCDGPFSGFGCVRDPVTGCAQRTALTCGLDEQCGDGIGCYPTPLPLD